MATVTVPKTAAPNTAAPRTTASKTPPRTSLSKPEPGSRAAQPPGKPSLLTRIKALLIRAKARPSVRHLMLSSKRYSERLGSQFAGAITYFSILAMVPILMVAFSVAGFVLYAHPDVLTQLENKIGSELPGGLSSTIQSALQEAVSARFTVGIVGLVIALYSGVGWMGNVRQAVQAQWRPDFDENQEMARDGMLKNLAKNLYMLAGLGVAIVVSLALSSLASALTSKILDWLGLADESWLKPLVVVGTLLLAMAADVLIFLWVYSVLPPKGMKAPRRALVLGSIFAAVAFELLKFALTNLLPNALSGGATAKVFGPIIGLLAFFNLVATLVLRVASWIATAPGGPSDREREDVELQEVPEPAVIVRETVSKPKMAGMFGLGAVLGVGWAQRRRVGGPEGEPGRPALVGHGPSVLCPSDPAEHQGALDLLDRLGDLDAAGTRVGAVERGAAAPHTLRIGEDLQPLLRTLITRVER